MLIRTTSSTLFPYTTLFRSFRFDMNSTADLRTATEEGPVVGTVEAQLYFNMFDHRPLFGGRARSEEHTSELQSQSNLVCRLLLEKKKMKIRIRAKSP